MKDFSSQEQVKYTQVVNHRGILNKRIKNQRLSKMHKSVASLEAPVAPGVGSGHLSPGPADTVLSNDAK